MARLIPEPPLRGGPCLELGCGHAWYDHTDAESLEDESIGEREPCRFPGCACQNFIYRIREQPMSS